MAIRVAQGTREPHRGLTPRQQEVADLIGEGLSDKQIAAKLDLAVNTVRCHTRNLRAALGVHSRVQIALSIASNN